MKSDFFSKEELEAFYCLLGLIYYNIKITRKYKITSVESIYGIIYIIKDLSLKMRISITRKITFSTEI